MAAADRPPKMTPHPHPGTGPEAPAPRADLLEEWLAWFPASWSVGAVYGLRVCPLCRAQVGDADVDTHAGVHVALGDLEELEVDAWDALAFTLAAYELPATTLGRPEFLPGTTPPPQGPELERGAGARGPRG